MQTLSIERANFTVSYFQHYLYLCGGFDEGLIEVFNSQTSAFLPAFALSLLATGLSPSISAVNGINLIVLYRQHQIRGTHTSPALSGFAGPPASVQRSVSCNGLCQ